MSHSSRAFSGPGHRLSSPQGSSSASSTPKKKGKGKKRARESSDEEGGIAVGKISKTKALEMYEDVGLQWFHLESIPCDKVKNPYGGEWPMKPYDRSDLAELAQQVAQGNWVNEYDPNGSSKGKKKKSKGRKDQFYDYDEDSDEYAGWRDDDADDEEAPPTPTPRSPSKKKQKTNNISNDGAPPPKFIDSEAAKKDFDLSEAHLGTLNCVGELPGSSNKTRLYKLNEVRALAIAVHGLDRFLNELLPNSSRKA